MQSMPTVGPDDVPGGSTCRTHGETGRLQRGKGQTQMAEGPAPLFVGETLAMWNGNGMEEAPIAGSVSQ